MRKFYLIFLTILMTYSACSNTNTISNTCIYSQNIASYRIVNTEKHTITEYYINDKCVYKDHKKCTYCKKRKDKLEHSYASKNKNQFKKNLKHKKRLLQ